MRPNDYVQQPTQLLDRCSNREKSLIEPKNNYDDSGEFLPSGRDNALDQWAKDHDL